MKLSELKSPQEISLLGQAGIKELAQDIRAEIIRTGNSVSTDDVDSAYRRFAQNNKMSVEQLSTIMEKAGVGVVKNFDFVAAFECHAGKIRR